MKINKEIKLKCKVCGNTDFEYDEELFDSIDEAEQLKCIVCNKMYTQDELREANSVLIENSIEELKNEEIEKALKKLKF